VSEAVTNKDFFRVWLFLIDPFSDLLNGKSLLTLGGEVHNGASLRLAKQIFNALHFAQTHRQKGFDRLPLYGLAFLAADRASIRGAGRALKILRGQFANGASGLGWATARVSH